LYALRKWLAVAASFNLGFIVLSLHYKEIYIFVKLYELDHTYNPEVVPSSELNLELVIGTFTMKS
jgi:hypothetical protein